MVAQPLTMIGRPICTCDCKCATTTNWDHARRYCGCCPGKCDTCTHGGGDDE